MSSASLLSAQFVGVTFLFLNRSAEKRNIRAKVLLRAVFPRRLFRSASVRADLGFLFINVFAGWMPFAWGVLSSEAINRTVDGTLADLFGALPRSGLSGLATKAIVTVSLFLAYEIAYWTDHYLSHRIPWLWEFHKVHHTAELLTPMTNYRVHPVDTAVFANFVAVFVGSTGGVLSYLLGQPVSPFAMNGTNVILLTFVFTTVHLQHSHFWMAFNKPLGFVLFSPAHHQLHHSVNPEHFNKNFGSCLAVWDWMFGTLHMPAKSQERLTFGVEPRTPDHHTAMGGLVTPWLLAWRRIWLPRREVVRV
jgi:sterol desaturase/sphingolipid hydroxylase (fatty acid hydroxylase superfamily)